MGTLVNLAGFQHGVAQDETAINIASFNLSVAPHDRQYINDKNGDPRGYWEGALRRDISLSGEITNTTGVMAFTFGTACTLANTVTAFGATTGTVTLMDAQITQERDGFRSLTQNLRADTGIVLA